MQGRDKKDKKKKKQKASSLNVMTDSAVGSIRKMWNPEQAEFEKDKKLEEAKGAEGMFDFDSESDEEELKEKKGDYSSEEDFSSEDSSSSSEEEEDFDDYYNTGDHYDLTVFRSANARIAYLQKLTIGQLFDMRSSAYKTNDKQTKLFIDEYLNKLDPGKLKNGIIHAIKLVGTEEALKAYDMAKRQGLSSKMETMWIDAAKDRLVELYDLKKLKEIIKEGVHPKLDILKEVLVEKEKRMYEGEVSGKSFKTEEFDYYPTMAERQTKPEKNKEVAGKMQRAVSSRLLDKQAKHMYEIEDSGVDNTKAENVDYYPGKEKEKEKEQEPKRPQIKRLDLTKKMEEKRAKRGSKTFRLEDIKRLGGNSKTAGSFLIQSTRNLNTSRNKSKDPEQWGKGQSLRSVLGNSEEKTELSPRVKGESIKQRFNQLFNDAPKLASTTSAISTRKGNHSPTEKEKLKGNTSARKLFFEEEVAKQSPRTEATSRVSTPRMDDGSVMHEKGSHAKGSQIKGSRIKPGSKG